MTALGTCWAVTVMGSSNTVVADTVSNDIYGWDETVFFTMVIRSSGTVAGNPGVKPTAAGRLKVVEPLRADRATPPGWRRSGAGCRSVAAGGCSSTATPPAATAPAAATTGRQAARRGADRDDRKSQRSIRSVTC